MKTFKAKPAQKPRPKKSITVQLDNDLYEEVSRLADLDGCNNTQFTKQLIEWIVESRKHENEGVA